MLEKEPELTSEQQLLTELRDLSDQRKSKSDLHNEALKEDLLPELFGVKDEEISNLTYEEDYEKGQGWSEDLSYHTCRANIKGHTVEISVTNPYPGGITLLIDGIEVDEQEDLARRMIDRLIDLYEKRKPHNNRGQTSGGDLNEIQPNTSFSKEILFGK